LPNASLFERRNDTTDVHGHDASFCSFTKGIFAANVIPARNSPTNDTGFGPVSPGTVMQGDQPPTKQPGVVLVGAGIMSATLGVLLKELNPQLTIAIFKKDAKKGGILQFGTEAVTAADGSLACLLGASPGASTAVSIMIKIIERCFRNEMAATGWRGKLREMIPSFGQSLTEDAALAAETRGRTGEALELRADRPLARAAEAPVS
jgi:hypothetical protein